MSFRCWARIRASRPVFSCEIIASRTPVTTETTLTVQLRHTHNTPSLLPVPHTSILSDPDQFLTPLHSCPHSHAQHHGHLPAQAGGVWRRGAAGAGGLRPHLRPQGRLRGGAGAQQPRHPHVTQRERSGVLL